MTPRGLPCADEFVSVFVVLFVLLSFRFSVCNPFLLVRGGVPFPGDV